MVRNVWKSCLLSSLIFATSNAIEALEFKVNGFLTAGAQILDEKKFSVAYDGVTPQRPAYDNDSAGNNGISSRPNFHYDSLLGMQAEAKVSEKLGFVAQFLAPGYNQYGVEASWAFAKYHFNENFVGRAGRLRMPLFLTSEYLQVGYAYPWITPPRHVYYQVPLSVSNYTGADATWNTNVLHQDLSISVFGGQVRANYQAEGGTGNITGKANNATGANINFGNEVFSVRAAYAAGKAKYSPNDPSLESLRTLFGTLGSSLATSAANQKIYNDLQSYFDIDNKSISFTAVGYKLEWKDLYSVAEYTRVRFAGWNPNSYGWYGTLGYRIMDKFLPTVTFSQYRTTNNDGLNRLPTTAMVNGDLGALLGATAINASQYQAYSSAYASAVPSLKNATYRAEDSWIVAVKYDVIDNVALKASWTAVKPKKNTYGLFDSKPGKKIVNIYGLAMNLVF